MTRKILFGGMASWLARAVNIALGLVLMPVLFHSLSSEELGVWLLVGQSCAILGIFDFGFSMVLTRRIAFALGKNPADQSGKMAPATIEEMSDLLATGRRLCRWLAVGAFGFSFGLGCVYLRSLHLEGASIGAVWMAWALLCLGQAFGIWALAWTCLLQGLGYVGWDVVLVTAVNTVTLVIQILLASLGTGLGGLAAAAAAGALAQRWLIMRFARNRRAELFGRTGRFRAELLREMLWPATRGWLTSLGCLLVANTDQFFIAATRGASAIPSYRAAFLLLINLHLLAGVFCAPSQVFVSTWWQAGQMEPIHAVLRRNARFGLLAMGCGGGAILALGPALFDFWIGPGHFVGYPVLAIFLVTFALEHHANVFSSCARATDYEAYALSSLMAGLLKLGLALALSRWLGLVGLALSTLVAQGLTNDWFMVYRSLQRLKMDFAVHVREVLAPCSLIFALALVFGRALDRGLAGQLLSIRVAMVVAFAGILLAASVWHLALDSGERNRVLQWVRFA